MAREACPLCGQDNACGMDAGSSTSRCWCEDVTMGADLLAKVPEAAKGTVCICRACALAALKREGDADRA
jgi:hypothetical protein